MRLEPLGTLELHYTRFNEVKFEAGGRAYGHLEGKIEGPELKGTLNLTNLAAHRTTDDYEPTLRGILETPEGGSMFVSVDGLSVLEPGANPPTRVGLVSITFRTGDPKLEAWNRVFAVAEYWGKTMGDSWGLVGTTYRCVPEASRTGSNG